ncbi:MAG: general secretion pathway protein D [Arenicella sp.]|jgi:general secretion pathway protein D
MSQITSFIAKRSMLAALCASLTFCLGVSISVAQERDSTGSSLSDNAEQSDAQITLKLEDVDIRVLINTVAEVSGKNFIVDPRVKGKVSVISGATLNPDQLYDVFLSILEVHNFATVDSGNVIKILPSNVIKQRPTPLLFSPSSESNDAQVTQIIQLKHASVQDLVPIIRPLIPPTSHFAPHIPSNSVVITDTLANIQRVLQIIRKIDVPDKRSNISVVNLDFAKASELAATLTQLVAATADPKDAGSAGKISIQAFDAINSLVISAPDEQYGKIQALIDELDIEREVEGNVNVISLKHAKAEDLAAILKDLTSSTAAGAISDFTVQADEASNSLIVKASGTQLKTVKSVVEKLDKRRAQVFVETIIAEVSLDQSASLGINWSVGGPRVSGTGDTATSSGNLINLDRPGLPAATASSSQAFEVGNTGYNYSLLDLGRYQLDIILNAIASDTNSNVLSTPTILTLDNEEAEIIVGQEVPFVTGSFNNGFNNTNTDGTNGGNVPVGNGFQTIERRDVGISLKIKPQINEGDTIQLEVLQETSAITSAVVAGVTGGVITNRRSIQAVVQVDDGQIVALGGLISDDIEDTVSKVPFLGDIPIIGNLFRSKTKRAIKRNLMVFLKPHIIRSPADLAKFSRSKYNDVRRDSQIAANQNPSFIIKDSAAPILVEYDTSINDGVIGSERRAKLARDGVPKSVPRKLKDIIFGRKTKPDSSEDGNQESPKIETSGKLEAIELEQSDLETVIEGEE